MFPDIKRFLQKLNLYAIQSQLLQFPNYLLEKECNWLHSIKSEKQQL